MEGHGLPCCLHMGTFNLKHIIKIRQINIFKQICAIWKDILFSFWILSLFFPTWKFLQKQGCNGQAFISARWIKVKKSVETTGYEGIKYSKCAQSQEWCWSWCNWLSLRPWFALLALTEGQKSQLLVIAEPGFGQHFQTGLLWGSLTMPHSMFIHWNLCLAFLLW